MRVGEDGIGPHAYRSGDRGTGKEEGAGVRREMSGER